MQNNYEMCIERAVETIRSKTSVTPAIGLILGSGLGDFVNQLEVSARIPYCDIPGLPLPTVDGHNGAFVFGTYRGKSIIALEGRVHYYEGYSQAELTLPVRIMSLLGVQTLILTNAAGGINLTFHPGTLMIITDHINFSGSNPLIGRNMDRFGPRFPDMSAVYTPELRARLQAQATAVGVELREGVYAMYSGPSYETPAEIRFFRMMGADAVGMSTVPEALVASHCGMQVLGLSCITNMAAGVLDQKLSHAEVIEAANRVKETFTKVLTMAIGLV